MAVGFQIGICDDGDDDGGDDGDCVDACFMGGYHQ